MIQALVHGKLAREQENAEDILTSNVFGLLRYVPPASALLPFLADARGLDSSRPLEFLTRTSAGQATTVEYCFWPSWAEEGCLGCEPDVVLTIHMPGGPPVMVLIEAKFRSGKSSQADDACPIPTDQLAREWDSLRLVARAMGARPFLIFLTQDACQPVEDIEVSVREWHEKRHDVSEVPQILWLSWRLLNRLQDQNCIIISDLKVLLRRLQLTLFEGVRVAALAPTNWRFAIARGASTGAFSWMTHLPALKWRFGDE